jgi:diaminohydroxyphosphoribosylaminopyrimidine deaminase/5-amino-6-(5-phosphoribosylamino)uracil reductase
MAIALSLGRRGLGRTAPNPAVGALVVQFAANGPVIVGRGWTQPGGRPHAETQALARAGAAARGATLYVTLEPCSHTGKTPPCTDAVVAAGIATVVSAIEDPNPEVAGAGHARLRAAGVVIREGVMAAAAAQMHAGHIRRMREGRPHVLLKLAVSADGKVGRLAARASASEGSILSRGPVAITHERARDRVHMLRAMSDAILIGIGTALADDPALTCRLPGMSSRSPMRIVLDADLRLPPDSHLVRTAAEVPVWVVAGASASTARDHVLRDRGVLVIRSGETAPGRLDPRGILHLLAQRGVTRLMIEGGPTVAATWIAAGLVDEIALFRSSVRIGPDGVDALEGLPISALTRPTGLHAAGRETIGCDTLETFVRNGN